jgi:acyl transferase domain-containing protein
VLVPLSAATPSALEALEARVREFVRSTDRSTCNDLAATAQRRRAHHRCRVVIRCATLRQLAAG